MSINNRELPPTFLNYDVDLEPDLKGAITYVIGKEESDLEPKDRFKKFRIIAQSKSDNDQNISIDLNLDDLSEIADFAERDIEMKFRSLKVCQGGKEKNIVVLCSDAFEKQE